MAQTSSPWVNAADAARPVARGLHALTPPPTRQSRRAKGPRLRRVAADAPLPRVDPRPVSVAAAAVAAVASGVLRPAPRLRIADRLVQGVAAPPAAKDGHRRGGWKTRRPPHDAAPAPGAHAPPLGRGHGRDRGLGHAWSPGTTPMARKKEGTCTCAASLRICRAGRLAVFFSFFFFFFFLSFFLSFFPQVSGVTGCDTVCPGSRAVPVPIAEAGPLPPGH